MRRSLAAACALTCSLAVAQERGRLIKVRAGGDAAESFIELVGDRPLSFTTLKLRSPARVIVDFADTDLALAERDLPVDDGTIRRVAAAPAGQKTARVVIELLADAEFAVRAHGSTIEVRVPRIAPLLAKVEREPTGPGAQPLPEAARAAGSPGARTQVAAAEPPSTGPNPAATGPSPQLAPSPEVAQEAAAGGGAQAARSSAVGDAVAAAGQAGAPDEARAAPSSAEASAPAGAAAAESQKRASLPTVALVGSRQSLPPPESAPARKRREKEERVAAYAAAQRGAAEQSAAAQRAARERRLVAAAGQRSAAERAAEERSAGKRAAPDRQRKVATAAPRHSITGIGFRPVGGGEVIVRSDQPLEYGVAAEGDAVVLHLPGAGIALPNNRRPLDTRFFGGPVQRVVPLAVASGTDLRIEVRGHADYQLAQAGGVLTVTFSAPR